MKTRSQTKRKKTTCVPEPAAPVPVVNANLRGIVEAIRKLRASGEMQTAQTDYRIGQLVQHVEDDPKKFGHTSDQSAVKFVAKQLGCGKDTLYNSARISRFWTPKEFGGWLKKEGKEGAHLTSAHFTEVLKLHDPNARDGMLERALADNMSTRDVRRAVQAAQPATPTPKSKLSQFKKLIGSSQKAVTAWQGIEALVGDGGIGDVALIDRAAELQHRLSELCLENSRALHRKLDGLAGSTAPKLDPVATVSMPDVASKVAVVEVVTPDLPAMDVVAGIAVTDAQPVEPVVEFAAPDAPLIAPAPDSPILGASKVPPPSVSASAWVEASKKCRRLTTTDVPGPKGGGRTATESEGGACL